MQREPMIRAAEDFVRPAASIRLSDEAAEPAHRLLGEADLAERSWDRARLVFQCH